ncbi:pyrroline-5-carboxylate reductase [Pseudoflavonifractor phocaeensis]|uniref:pyrroline-5-carboxylate reductase n=1 Tax=Pseudoflavonifractor phocaeensis TaxID=1870988 RepID=UPI0025A38E36|nr:pyrroline-5-carboxylate reductase [Pseudoflavonifractor phocaeensis]MDM8237859.1 pyrroline-5-carboxylate reductase [Pseudoflavonifractor phocaeensis]
MDTLTGKKIGFIGGGRMGEGIFSGILKAGLIPPEDLYVADIVDQRLQELQEKYGLNPINSSTNEGIKQLIDQVDVVFLAVLPQVAPKLLPFINQCLDLERHYVFSIMGGVLTSTLEETLTQVSLVRIMPNTPMSVCAGCAGIVPGKNCKPEHKAMALEIFNQIGLGLLLPEPQIDPLTGISGCGPAFCGIMIQALADGGVYLGLSRADAIKIAAQTLVGTGKMVLEQGIHPEILKDNVCSPGGGTIGGTVSLERDGFRAACINAVINAVDRMNEVVK